MARCCLAAALLSLPVCAAHAAESWIADSKGCRVYNPNPLRGESITWDGPCAGGYAEGGGTLTLTDKRQFKTDLVTGVKWPSEFLAPAVLLVLCFDSASVLRTMDLVRSSGFPLEDERAFDVVRIREAHRENVLIGATSSEELVSDPIPGCHMVGVSYEHNDYVFFRRS